MRRGFNSRVIGIATLMMIATFPSYVYAKAEAFSFGHQGVAANVDRTVKIVALDTMRFSPAMLTVHAGETVRFVVTNRGHLLHEWVLGSMREQVEHEAEMGRMGMKMDHDPNGILLPPGKTATLIWTFVKPGKLYYACHEPGHYAAGMVGTIVVEPASPGSEQRTRPSVPTMMRPLPPGV